MRPEAQGASGRSLGATFRAELLKVYDAEADIPSLTGSYNMDDLQRALNTSDSLHRAALDAIRDVKTFSTGLPGIVGDVLLRQHDSLIGVWKRAALVRRSRGKLEQKAPVGRPANRTEFSLIKLLAAGRYSASARKAYFEFRHSSHGTAHSLSMVGSKRLALKSMQLLFDVSSDELSKVRLPSAGTCSLIDRTVQMVQMVKSVELTFTQVPYSVGIDEGSRNKTKLGSFLAGALTNLDYSTGVNQLYKTKGRNSLKQLYLIYIWNEDALHHRRHPDGRCRAVSVECGLVFRTTRTYD